MLTVDQLRAFGANVDEGIARCVGNEALYLRLANSVLKDPSFDRLAEGIRGGDLNGAFEAAQVRLGRKIGYADETTPGWGKSVLITVEEDGALAIRENTFLKPPPETGAWAPAPENG